MNTFEIIIAIGMGVVAGGSAGVGVFQLTRGGDRRIRGTGNIVVGLGFALMGWDLITPPGLSYAFGIGALATIAGGSLIPLKRSGSDNSAT